MDCQYEVKEIVVVYNNYKLENADQVGNPVNRNLQYTDQEYKKNSGIYDWILLFSQDKS